MQSSACRRQNRTQSRGRSNADLEEWAGLGSPDTVGRGRTIPGRRAGGGDRREAEGEEPAFRAQEVRDIKGSGHGIHWRAFFFLFFFLKDIFIIKKKQCETYTTKCTVLLFFLFVGRFFFVFLFIFY